MNITRPEAIASFKLNSEDGDTIRKALAARIAVCQRELDDIPGSLYWQNEKAKCQTLLNELLSRIF